MSNSNSSCPICTNKTPNTQMIHIDICSHRYCLPCMTKHTESNLLNNILPNCPHENCKSKLKLETCKLFLPPNLLKIMIQRLKEASIPVTDRVYCPFPKCSALMSVNLEGRKMSPRLSCVDCFQAFCVDCKVGWHDGLSCHEYIKRNPDVLEDEEKLKALAGVKLWRQCGMCNHMIELARGCNHIICRCGYGFCYVCGAEWKMRTATCSCPFWVEENILY